MESENETTKVTTKAQLQACGLTLNMTRMAWTKLMAYCRATNLETSGFMLLERDGDQLLIDEIYLLPQESTSTSTEMDRTAIAKFQLELYKKGIIGKRDSKKKLAHWHTHPTFGVFWSGTDMEMRRLNSQGVDYFVSIVVNQKGDALAAIDINGEFPLSINDLPIEIVEDPSVEELIKACKAEVELKVKSPTSSWEGYGSGNYHGYGADRGRTWYNPETRQWQTHEPGKEPERLVLESDPPQRTVDTPSDAIDIEKLKLLGPGDRRTRKAIKNLERLTKKITARAGRIRYEEWKRDQDLLDRARQAVRNAALGLTKKANKDNIVAAGADDGEITIVEDQPADDGILMSDERGTWENIGGEVVRVDDASQVIYE